MTALDERVLLVDDDPSVLRVYAKVLTAQGWVVETAEEGRQALELLHQHAFDVIVSDVFMPRMGGLAFLRAVRELDPDLPVILMAGEPELESAVRAVEYGAFRYLQKPIAPHALTACVHHAMQLHCMARLKREALGLAGVERRRLTDRVSLEARFAMATKLFWMAYQPIVSLHAHDVFGYEALLRSYEPTMRKARDVLDAAERLGRVCELGRATRTRVAADALNAPSTLFVNLHSLEVTDDDLYDASSPLGRIARSVVLEITDRAPLDHVTDLGPRVARLRALGFRIALDDLGAGYAGLTTYSRLEPDIAKIDMSFVRNIDTEPRKKRIVQSMLELCRDLGTVVIASGVETTAERDTLSDVGCDLVQGYLFARPESGFATPAWGAEAPRLTEAAHMALH